MTSAWHEDVRRGMEEKEKSMGNPDERTPDEVLSDLASLFAQRNATYGADYKLFGPRMRALFPNGLELSTEDDFQRFGMLVFIVSKLGRYCNSFESGGHADSLDDLAVYSAMLSTVDRGML